MKSGANTNSVKKDLSKTGVDLSDTKQWNKFFMQVAMEPYSELGTGKRCKAKECDQPVYDHESGLCSYHRMMEAERAFEDRLKARRHPAMIERDKGSRDVNGGRQD